MPKSRTFDETFDVPPDLWPLVQRRIDEEQYDSISDYLVGLVILDRFGCYKHEMPRDLMREPHEIVYKVIEQLVRDFDDPNVERSPRWFQTRISELVAQEKAKARVSGEQ